MSSSGFLTALLESTSDYIMIADERGLPVLFNKAYAAIIKEALGVEMRPGLQPHSLLDDPEGKAFWDGLHARVLGGEQFTIELPQLFPSGETRHFSFSFSPIVEGERVTGFCEISREITSQKQAEVALRESERTLRESQEVAQIGSYLLDIPSGRWTSSAILDSILGIDADFEHTVDKWVGIVHPDHRAEMLRYFTEDVVGKRDRFDREYLVVRVDDGAERWVHGLGRLELDDDGQPVKMIGTIRDVTERKEMEAQILQQEKMQAIGELAGGVAHDFNNQLMGILGYADILKSEAVELPALQEYADKIILAAKRAADLTSQLLAFSRKGKYTSVQADLHHIVAEVVGILRHTIDKRIKLEQRLRASPSTTSGDPSQLQNAILNLAINARDAMPEGGQLLIETDVVELKDDLIELSRLQVDPGSYVLLRVTDSGVGIAPEILDRIFEPFFSTKDPGQGTGMGLAAVYGTVRNHRGAVRVDSELKHGTTIKVYLPVSRTGAVEAVEASGEVTAPASQVKVLFVDDDEAVLEIGRKMLVRLGYQVIACRDGAEAVELYRRDWREIDVVVLDMMMPVMGGREAITKMHEVNAGVRALMASGYSVDGIAQDLHEQGVRGFLQKPFTVAELAAKIEAVLAAS